MDEPGRLVSPGFADGFVRCEAAQGFQTTGEVVGGDEVGEMLTQLIVAFVVIASDRRVLDRSIHAFDLAVRPRMARLGQSVCDVELGAGEREGVAEERLSTGSHLLDVLRRPAVAGGIGEVRAIVGEHGVDPVGDCGRESPEEVAGDPACGLLVQLSEGELRGSVDGHEEVEFALLGPDLGDVDMDVAERVAFELALVGLVALHLRQAGDAMALKASMEA